MKKGLNTLCETSQFKTNTEIISFLKNVSYVINHEIWILSFIFITYYVYNISIVYLFILLE